MSLVDPVLASLVALRDRLPTHTVKEHILDCFDLTSIKNAKKILWVDQETFLRAKKKKWTDHRRTAQRSAEEAELDDLVDFVNCLDEAENLPPVSVNAGDLSTLPAAVLGTSPVETSESCGPVQSVQSVQLKEIQDSIERLSQELKQSLIEVQNLPPVRLSGGPGVEGVTTTVPTKGLRAPVRPISVDRSRNVILFGVPESRNLLDTESLVSRALEFAVGRKIEFVDCRRLGRYSQGQKRNRPLLVKLVSVWDRRLLLSSKFRLKGFADAQVFVREDLAPEDRKSKDAVPKTLPVHLSGSAAVVVDMHRTSIVPDGSQCEKSN